MNLTVETKKQEGTCYVSPKGIIDSESSDYFYDEIKSELDEKVHVLVLNMSEVVYMSSLGLGMLFKMKKDIESTGGTFILTELQPQIQKIFKVIKALPSLNVFKSVEEADAYLDNIQKKELEDNGGE
ncbi:MAG: STAS domain-containing protein [Candidatus Omnitrophica bacterium]|nr:STAS domain-containing protein [Candidatus Omnitrophota bacterium]